METENISFMKPISSKIEYPTLSLHEMYPETDDEMEMPMVWNQGQNERSLETPPPTCTDLHSFQIQQSSVVKLPPTFTGYLPDIVKDGVKSKEIFNKPVTEQSKGNSSPLSPNILSKIWQLFLGG